MNDKLDPRALTDAFREPDEASSKQPSGRIPHKGVIIASRFNLTSELERMRRAIDAMPDVMVLCLESIWCDSKESDRYAVGVKPNLFAPELPGVVADAFRTAGGHNGIAVYGAEGQFEDIEPDWPGGHAMVA